MKEIIKVDPEKYNHLEKIVQEIDIGDILRVFFKEGPGLYEFQLPKSTTNPFVNNGVNRAIVSEQHLPKSLRKEMERDNIIENAKKEDKAFTGYTGATLAGIFHGYWANSPQSGGKGGIQIAVPQKQKIGNISRIPETKEYTTEPTLWLKFGMHSFIDEDRIKRIPNAVHSTLIYVDIHAMKAFEKIAENSMYAIPRQVQQNIFHYGELSQKSSKERKNCKSHIQTITHEERIRLFDMIRKKNSNHVENAYVEENIVVRDID